MIYEKIQSDVKEAMKARQADRLSALRFLHSEVKNVGINERVEITDEVAIRVISKLAKQRREGVEEARRAGRADLAAKEEAELALLESYLPRAMSEDELRAAVQAVIQEVGASSKRDMGKVMKASLAKLAGRADGRAVQAVANALLS